jgi:signal transduction histidine kinase
MSASASRACASVALVDGELEIASSADGTRVAAALPLAPRD